MTNRHRRLLTLGTLAEYCQEIERLDNRRAQASLERAGNWSLDQCCQHLGRWIEFSIDGFPFAYPFIFRLIGRLVRLVSWRWLVSMALRPGFMNPPSAKAVDPDAIIAEGDGVKYLLNQIGRIETGERMDQPSPVEGRITHDQWCYFHLRHAELHLSFLEPA